METKNVQLSKEAAKELWDDVRNYFIELFMEKPKLLSIKIKAAQLVDDLGARFKGKYNAEKLIALLSNGYQVNPGEFIFMRTDFIMEHPKHLEVAAS